MSVLVREYEWVPITWRTRLFPYLTDSVAKESGELAVTYNISQEEQDEFAYSSHMKYGQALERGFFKNEIVPLEMVKTDRGLDPIQIMPK